MKEYLEFNNAYYKRLSMICVSERSKTMRFTSADVRRELIGLPITIQFTNFKFTKTPIYKMVPPKIRPFNKLSKLKSVSLLNYSKYFKSAKEYDLFRRYNK